MANLEAVPFQTVIAGHISNGQTLFTGELFSKVIQLKRSTTVYDILAILYNLVQVVDVYLTRFVRSG